MMQRPAPRWTRWLADPAVQARLARLPLVRRLVRREGEALFDLVAGFCHSQVLMALVRLDLPARLLETAADTATLAAAYEMPEDGLELLLRAAAAIGLVRQRRGLWRLTPRGAALAGVPGLAGMIDHHEVLYQDLADPVAFFRGEVETRLADFWPYVFGAGAAEDPEAADRYSRLMADSQALVAEDTLAMVDFSRSAGVLDVGGGTGAFLAALGARHAGPRLTLFDLPAVIPAAEDRLARAGLSARTRIVAGSFRDDPLPEGSDTVTLVRVLYDHADETVRALLRAVHAALPPGGRVVISEPMTGGSRPERAGDAYFALYCRAMRTGRARSADRIAGLLHDAGFEDVQKPAPPRPYVTRVVTGVRKS